MSRDFKAKAAMAREERLARIQSFFIRKENLSDDEVLELNYLIRDEHLCRLAIFALNGEVVKSKLHRDQVERAEAAIERVEEKVRLGSGLSNRGTAHGTIIIGYECPIPEPKLKPESENKEQCTTSSER
jgi:hypothetical protein